MKEINPERYYSSKDLSERWKISTRTIIRLIQDKKIGRQYRILEESILEYEARNMNIKD